MRSGDLIMVKGRGLVPLLIRLATGSKWNHVEILVGGGMCVGADLRLGVVEREIVEAVRGAKEAEVFRVVSASDVISARAASRSLTMLGRRYDLGGTIGVLVKLLCVRLGLGFVVFWGANKASAEDAFFCSELVASLYREQGIQLFPEDPSYISPRDIAESTMVMALDEKLA